MGIRAGAMLVLLVGGVGAAAAGVPGGLTSFLVRGGEEPGFSASAPRPVAYSVQSWIGGAPASQAAVDGKRYRAEGFVAATSESTKGANGAVGLSVAVEFRTRAGALREQAHLLHPGRSWRRFVVAGVPGAGGVVQLQASSSAANVVWVEGRCTLVVGDLLPHSTHPLTAPLVRAAAAVHRRTGGSCP